jgi:hypothetical protein
LTDADLISWLQETGLHDTLSVDVRSVRAPEIDNDELASLALNDGMM